MNDLSKKGWRKGDMEKHGEFGVKRLQKKIILKFYQSL